jgi:non-specific serine/threonine protein kinase
MLEEGLALLDVAPDPRGELQIRHSLGLVAIYRGDFARAQGYYEQNLTGWRSLDDSLGVAQTLNNLGLALRYQGQFDEAAKCYEECLALGRELQDLYGVAASLHNLGQMAHHQGDDARAHRLLAESLLIGRQIGDRPNISARLADIAAVWAAQSEPVRAARLFGAAETLREDTGANMYGGQREVYEQDVKRTREQLVPATWEAAWAEGRTLSLEEAYALALEDLPARTPVPGTPQRPYDLSERELEVLRLLVVGLTYAEIAERLTLSFHTVHAHLRAIYNKLGVGSRKQATRFAIEHGLA